jgi:riboflavin synthase
MFTGLIEDIGVVSTVESRQGGRSLEILAKLELKKGNSVSVNGVCLTAVGVFAGGFRADVGPETVRKSNLGRLRRGDRLNLERAVKADDRLGGHLVTGHVDGTGQIISMREEGAALWVVIKLPSELVRYVIERGSICIDGVSLTVARLSADIAWIMVIPETRESTIVSGYRIGTVVNVEVDVLAKMIEKSVKSDSEGMNVSYLEDQGY